MSDQPTSAMASALRENIAAMRARRHREERAARLGDRVAAAITSFVGSMSFVCVHLVLYGAWVAINLGAVPGVKPFDPSFVVLATEASVEAIFLSTFVLIAQNRMAAAADRRADLDLHINLLAEHELTRLAGLVMQVAERLGIDTADPDLVEITRDVEPDHVLNALAADHPG